MIKQKNRCLCSLQLDIWFSQKKRTKNIKSPCRVTGRSNRKIHRATNTGEMKLRRSLSFERVGQFQQKTCPAVGIVTISQEILEFQNQSSPKFTSWENELWAPWSAAPGAVRERGHPGSIPGIELRGLTGAASPAFSPGTQCPLRSASRFSVGV
jgi:hypothetical protein